MDVQIAFYGSQSLLRGSCEFCGSQTFVIDGENACCGSTPDTIRIVDVRRLTSPGGRRKGTLGVKHKARILQAQEYRCFWCEHVFGTTYIHKETHTNRLSLRALVIEWDHHIPYSFSQDNRPSNMVASCQVCNRLKHDLYYDTVEQGQRDLQERWRRHGYQIEKEATVVWKMRPLL